MGPLRARRKLYANKADSRGECREGTWGVPSSVAYEVPRNEPDTIYIGLNNRDARCMICTNSAFHPVSVS